MARQVRGCEGLRTVRRVLLHDLHCPCDARFLAVGMVEEGEIAFLHGAEVVAGCVGPKVLLAMDTKMTFWLSRIQ